MRRLTAALTLALATAALAALPRAQQSQTPQFKTGTELVAIDFLALDDKGRPVIDLKAGDVTLRVDGKPREIRSFQFVKIASTSAEAPKATPPLPLPFGANDDPTPSRSVLIIVDHEHIPAGQGKAALTAAGSFLDRLRPADRVAVLTLPNGKVEVDLTTNHARARDVLATIVGRSMRRGVVSNISLSEALTVLVEKDDPDKTFTKELVDRECKFAPDDSFCRTRVVQEANQIARDAELSTRATLRALQDVFEGLKGVEAPTTVLFISGSLPRFADTHLDLAEVAKAAARARAQMFIVQPDEGLFDASVRDQPPSASVDTTLKMQGLEDLAGITGGEMFRQSGAGNTIFNRIADAISAHYLLGFEPQAPERDGGQHKLAISVSRPGVSVRVRPSFVIDDPTRAPPLELALDTQLKKMDIRRDLALHAVAYTFRDSTDPAQRRIVVAVEPADSMTTLVGAAFALIDVQGHHAARWTEDGTALLQHPVVTGAAVPPADYRLRVAATDNAGRIGTVDYEFTAQLTETPQVTMSALMTGSIDQGAFRPELFPAASDPAVTGYFEFYGQFVLGTAITVRFEIAATPDGPALASVPGEVTATSTPARFIATGTIPLRSITSPEVVVRAVLSLNDKVVGRVIRTYRRHP